MATEAATRRSERARHVAALVAAAALHAVVVVVAASVARAPEVSGTPSPALELADIELSVVSAATADGAPTAPRGDAETSSRAAAPAVAGAGAVGERPRAVPLPPPGPDQPPRPEGTTEPPGPPPDPGAPSPPTAPMAPGAPTSEYGAAPPPLPILTGPLSMGAPLWTVPGAMPAAPTAAPAPTTSPKVAPAPDIATRVVTDVLREHDRFLGVGTPGATTVGNALAAAVRASTAPSDSAATFVVSLGPDGSVTSVRVDSFRGGDTTLWNGLAKGVAGQLAGQKLTIAGNTHGAVVRVALVSAVQAGSGTGGGGGIRPTGPPKPEEVRAGVPRTHAPFADNCTASASDTLRPICMPGGLGGSFDATSALVGAHRLVKTSFTVTLKQPPTPPAASAKPTL